MGEEIKTQMEKNKKTETELNAANDNVDKLQEKVTTVTRKYDTEVKKRERNDRELKELNLVLQHRQQDIKQKTILIQQGLETIAKLEHRLKEETARTDRAVKDFDLMQQ